MEAEAAEEIAPLLFADAPVELAQVVERRVFGMQLVNLVLREVADANLA